MRWEQLVACADILISVETDEQPTTSLAWAMASSTGIITAVNYATTELIAHRHNGTLIKPEPGPALSVQIARAILDDTNRPAEIDRAKSQAYQVFGLRRFADQHARLYQNLTTGDPPDSGITDSAVE